jgi:hypothetical protein
VSIVGLATAIIEGPVGKTQPLVVDGVDEDGAWVVEPWALQFWPETVSISASVNYADKQVIGGSHPIRQWTGGGGRSMSLSLMVGRDMKRKVDLPGISFLMDDPQSVGNAEWNYDVRREIDRFMAFTLPTYTKDDVGAIAKPPPTIRLWAAGMAWSMNPDSRDVFVGTVKSVNVTYKRVFTETGIARLATIDVQIDESVQQPGGGVMFVGVDDLKRSPWWGLSDG